ncbi:hypothetical protein IT570_06075 [Candidatus Sumerlaeota bacterium]|nr:hypothetical protein [Candidatus Sumerlaeota bacterium]
MAANKPPQDDSQVFRNSLKSLWRAIVIVVPIVLLVVCIYMIFGGNDPRRKLKTPPETLAAYTHFISSYIGPMAVQPDRMAISQFLQFFDAGSRDFFEKNYEALARQRHQFELEAFKSMSTDSKRADAMLNLAQREPLSGFGAIKTSQNPKPDQVEIHVDTRTNKQVTVTLEKSGSIYYIEDFAGLKPALEKELAAHETKNN